MKATGINNDRIISLGKGRAEIPERLLLAHARGEVLFIAGAGISKPANLPDFRGLVLSVYSKLDPVVHDVISKVPAPPKACFHWSPDFTGLTHPQTAEVRRFIDGDYDVVLGMLERRLDDVSHLKSQVRRVIIEELRKPGINPAPIHKALMQLADRGGAVTIVTTNFDLLLERASIKLKVPTQTYALGGIPRPGRGEDFAGVMHIHGALAREPAKTSDLVVSDQDFGEFYLRRRVVPDFIHDAARLYNLVLVGYSANDPPMKYLLNAVAADGKRFGDLKERFAFIGHNTPDPVEIEDWRGRGITPVPYDAANNHAALLGSLEMWAALSAINGKPSRIDSEIKRIVKKDRHLASDTDRDLFDHIMRRSDSAERIRLAALISKQKADIKWLDTLTKVCAEQGSEVKL